MHTEIHNEENKRQEWKLQKKKTAIKDSAPQMRVKPI